MRPAAGWSTFVTITMLCGLVGLTATVSSDSLPGRWLTSTFVGLGASCHRRLAPAAWAGLGCRWKLTLPATKLPMRATHATRNPRTHIGPLLSTPAEVLSRR